MAGFVDPCKVVARKIAFSALPIQVHEMKAKTVKKKNHGKKIKNERKDQRLI
jgi:hypothetical protein